MWDKQKSTCARPAVLAAHEWSSEEFYLGTRVVPLKGGFLGLGVCLLSKGGWALCFTVLCCVVLLASLPRFNPLTPPPLLLASPRLDRPLWIGGTEKGALLFYDLLLRNGDDNNNNDDDGDDDEDNDVGDDHIEKKKKKKNDPFFVVRIIPSFRLISSHPVSSRFIPCHPIPWSR